METLVDLVPGGGRSFLDNMLVLHPHIVEGVKSFPQDSSLLTPQKPLLLMLFLHWEFDFSMCEFGGTHILQPLPTLYTYRVNLLLVSCAY